MIDQEIRNLIRPMSKENLTWEAPRIHDELLMLGIEVARSTVAKYSVAGMLTEAATGTRPSGAELSHLPALVIPDLIFGSDNRRVIETSGRVD
jgi:hypothetical protein